jgi:histidine triad (HIT) family protein
MKEKAYTTMEDSIFTKIIKGEIPSHKVYEDEKTLAFLSIYPSVEGHTLVIPKIQVESLWDLDSEDYLAVMETSRKVALRIREVLGVERVGEKVIGLDIPHAHVHLVPFNSAEEYYAKETTSEPDHGALSALAERLKF